MITQYFINFDKIINSVDFIEVSNIRKRKINDFLGIIEAQIILKDKVLDILEVLIITDFKLVKKKYKYHFRTADNSLIFRYDNAPHHPEVKTFPHHKHLPDKIIESEEIDLIKILSEIKIVIEK